jgi:hypothetical protein
MGVSMAEALKARVCSTTRSLWAALSIILFLMAKSACAQQAIAAPLPGPRALIPFNIPSQPLASALEAYSVATGVQVLYESSLALRLRSEGITAVTTSDRALEMLIANTGLIVRYTGRNAITISRPSAFLGNQPPPSVFSNAALRMPVLQIGAGLPDKIALRAYSDAIRTQVEAALKRYPETRDGSYRVGVSLWVGGDRTVERAELFQSTGRASRDAAVKTVLQSLVINQDSPPNTPRPVKLVIVVRSL